jgi:membrane-bound metal-dependent hydrolase YbcI (DUF457 family)
MHPDHGWPFLTTSSHAMLSALWEVVAHGSLAVVVVLPIIWHRPRRVPLVLLAFFGGIVLDIDHAVAARSLDPRLMEQLGSRPDTHSLLFVSVLAFVALVVTRRRLIAWAVFAILVAHLLLDAPGGGVRWSFPLSHPDAIPWLACPIGIVLLTGISAMLVHAAGPDAGGRTPRSLPDTYPVDDHSRWKPRRGVGWSGPVAADREVQQQKARLSKGPP